MATDIKERAKLWIKSKDTAAMILEHGGVSGAAMFIYMQAATEQREIDIKHAQDAYCKVCGHFPHTVPTRICRQDCRYYAEFNKLMMEE